MDWRALVDEIPSAALAIEGAGRIVAANVAMGACLACDPASLLGTDFSAWTAEPAALTELLVGESIDGERDFRAADGTARRLKLFIRRRPDGWVICAMDVTAIRAAERALRERSERFSDLIGIGGGSFYEVSADMTMIRLWERDEATGGIAVRERHVPFPGGVKDPTFNPEGHEAAVRCIEQRLPERNTLLRSPTADGHEVFRLANSVPFYRDGVYQGRRGISVDVTGQVVAERALRESQARLHRAREHLDHAQRVAMTGSSVRDLATGTVEWSEEMYCLWGVDRASFPITDAGVFALVHEADRERMAAMARAARHGEPTPPIEFRINRPDGDLRTLYCEADLIEAAEGQASHLVTVFKDVTAERAAEARQREIEQQLLQAQKMEALGTLAGGVAHELNNTLVPVLALTKMTMKQVPDDSRAHKNLRVIHDASERARDLISQVVAFSRKESPTTELCDLGTVVREALRVLRPSLPASIRIEDRIDPAPPLTADPGHLHQVVTNLVTNAAQAIGNEPGSIAIEVTPAEAAIRLSVIDSGEGMDEATLGRVFEPFFTTRQVGTGTGLGLAVVHGIVTRHGGRIAIASRLGAGTRVDIHLPVSHR